MTELKTLKDFEVWAGNKEIWVDVKKLRKEAIKWWGMPGSANDFIKHFFNLTEEDLKDAV